MKNVVITGSSRGIGFGMAREFLKEGHRVIISGRTKESLEEGKKKLISETGNSRVDFEICDVSVSRDIDKLWKKASSYGNVDIWVNNAGIGQGRKLLKDLANDKISTILEINLKGLILASKYVYGKMLEQGSGAIYNMEGFGSDGRKMKGMSIYGTTKSAVRYFTRSLALESADLPVIVGTISPGMVVTDLLVSPLSEDNAEKGQLLKIINILADHVETVTPFLVGKMLNNKKNGAAFHWLNGRKIMWRFIRNIFIKRQLVNPDDPY